MLVNLSTKQAEAQAAHHKDSLRCQENGFTNDDDKMNLVDITRLIDHVRIGKGETAVCK